MIYLVKKRKMLRKPMLEPLNREMIKNAKDCILPRSGRIMRKLENSELQRTWKDGQSQTQQRIFSSNLNNQQLMGEIAYILQPLVHLTSLGIFGIKSWTPWVLSGCCDLIR